MTRHHYETGRRIEYLKHEEDLPFYGIMQGLMRLADSRNQSLLRMCWPNVWEDLEARYNAPGGRLEGDPPWPGDTVDEGYICTRCRLATFNPTDALVGYCGACRSYTRHPSAEPSADFPGRAS